MPTLRISNPDARLDLPAAECRACSKPFIRLNSMQVVCGVRCAIKLPVIDRKAERKELARRKEAIKPRAKWLAEAQQAFNAWIRARDEALGCISCGTREGKVNAGHYLSTGARPELRFDPLNVHRQCERCNTYLSGNLIPYRIALLERIGPAEVERLEGAHEPAKWTIEQLKGLIADCRAKTKQLKEQI